MRHESAVVALAGVLVLCLCVSALAQDFVLQPEDYHICEALRSDRGKDVCVEYYERKEALMNQVLKTYNDAMFLEPGNEELRVTVLQDITEWQDELDALYEEFLSELPEEEWTDELRQAFHQEVKDTDIAAQFWANECYIATMLLEDVYTLEDASKDFVEKIAKLRTLAEEIAEDYRDAQSGAGDRDAPARARRCAEFGASLAKAVTITYALDNMYDQMVDSYQASESTWTTYKGIFDSDDALAAQLPEEWMLDEKAMDTMIAMFEDRYEAVATVKNEVHELLDDTVFDDLGEPFDRISYGDLAKVYAEALEKICQ
jgi:hypothetical protein